MSGRYLGGIREVKDLRQRCYVSPQTGCWHWRLALEDGRPKVCVYVNGRHITMRGRRAALTLAGVPVASRTRPTDECQSLNCCNPAHAEAA